MAKELLGKFYEQETLESKIIKDSISMRDIYNNLTNINIYLINTGIQISWNFDDYFDIIIGNIIISNNFKNQLKSNLMKIKK